MADVTGGSEQVRGTKAHDAAADPNPVTIGGYASTSAPSAVSGDGDAVHAWFDPNGRQVVDTELDAAEAISDSLANPTTSKIAALIMGWTGSVWSRVTSINSTSDARGTSGVGLIMQCFTYLFNGSTWDRARGDTTNGLDVDVTRVIPGTTATALGKAEDAGHSTGDTGVMVLAVRNDTRGALAGTDLDYAPLQLNSSGDVRVDGSAVTQPVLSGGYTVSISANFTRPNDTNTYASGDVVTNSTSAPSVMTFSGCARANGGSGWVLAAELIDSANQTLKGQFELWLFDTTFTPDNDNAVFTPTDTELTTQVCVIPFNLPFVGDATAGAGGNVIYPGAPASGAPEAFTCGGGSTSLFGILVVRNAYVPVANGVFTVRLKIRQD